MRKSITRICGLMLVICLIVSLFSISGIADETDWDNPCASAAYADVNKSMWYHQAVDYVLKNNIMSGTSATPPSFSPDVAVSRAMAVQVLYALAGKPAGLPDAGFTDLTQDWYKDAVNWAVYHKITAGVGDGQFAPARDVTREQMALIFKAAAEYCRIDTSARGDLSKYSDAGGISFWAGDAMKWAISVGLLSGFDDSTLRPQATLSRAQLAQMLYRFHSGAIGTPGPTKVVRIAATYTGSTEHGTVLSRDNPGINVAAVYDDGHTTAVQDWTIQLPATLTAGETSTVTIFSGAMQCDLSVTCTTDAGVVYAKDCTPVTYEDLKNNPAAFLGKPVKISGLIYSNPEMGDNVVLYMNHDGTEATKIKLYISYKETDTRMRIMDEVTVYGDVRTMEGNLPAITVHYYTIDKPADDWSDTVER